MPESLPTELLQLRQRAERFAAEVLAPEQAAVEVAGEDHAAVRDRVTRAARESGFFSMTQPKSAGGSEAGLLALTVVREAVWFAVKPNAALAVPVPMTTLLLADRFRLDSAMAGLIVGWTTLLFWLSLPVILALGMIR